MATNIGTCEHCAHEFSYVIIHNGFDDSAYAYCDRCGCAVIISGWAANPSEGHLKIHERITVAVEPFLRPCSCGGKFTAGGNPRCPKCRQELSPITATEWIEANAPGTKVGWRWQQSWDGIYSIIIDGMVIHDPWRLELLD